MKLDLAKEWFEKNIPEDNTEVGAGLPRELVDQSCATGDRGVQRASDFTQISTSPDHGGARTVAPPGALGEDHEVGAVA